MAERSVRPGYAKGRARRTQILRAAETAFAEHGFRGASLATIARAAGLTEAGLLHHFPSKHALLISVLEYRDQDGIDRYHDQPGGVGTSPVASALDRCRETLDNPGLAQLFAVLAAESINPASPAHEHFVQRYRRVREITRTALEEQKREGTLAAHLDTEAAATQLIALWDGLQLQWLLDPERIDMVGVLGNFLNGLFPDAAAPDPPTALGADATVAPGPRPGLVHRG